MVLPNYPHHIVQRGHNRQVVFAGQEDFEYYLEILGECKEIYQVKIYAYCLRPIMFTFWFNRATMFSLLGSS